MDVVGVRAGCTLTAYSDSSYNGDRIDIKAENYDRSEETMFDFDLNLT